MALDEVGYDRLAIETQDGGTEVHIVGIDVAPSIAGLSAPLHSLAMGAFGISRKIGPGDFDWSPSLFDVSVALNDTLDRKAVTSLTPMTTTIETPIDYLSYNFHVSTAGNYKISVSYIWELDNTSASFYARLLVNGVTAWEHKQEPKEKTDQAHIVSYPDFVIPLVAGSHNVQLQFATSKKKKAATIQSAGVTIERWNT